MAILINKRVQFIPSDTICDPNGHYVIVSGSLFQVPVVLVNVYAPNCDDVQFANSLLSLIPKLNTHHLLFAGDFNCVFNLQLDRSNTSSNVSDMAKAFFSIYATEWLCRSLEILKPIDKAILLLFPCPSLLF